MPDENVVDDVKIEKQLVLEKIYYQTTDMEEAIDTVSKILKVESARVRKIAEKVYSEEGQKPSS